MKNINTAFIFEQVEAMPTLGAKFHILDGLLTENGGTVSLLFREFTGTGRVVLTGYHKNNQWVGDAPCGKQVNLTDKEDVQMNIFEDFDPTQRQGACCGGVYFDVVSQTWVQTTPTDKVDCKQLLAEKDKQLAEKDALLAEKDKQLAEKDALLAGGGNSNSAEPPYTDNTLDEEPTPEAVLTQEDGVTTILLKGNLTDQTVTFRTIADEPINEVLTGELIHQNGVEYTKYTTNSVKTISLYGSLSTINSQGQTTDYYVGSSVEGAFIVDEKPKHGHEPVIEGGED